MITARRLHERQAEGPPPTRNPDTISYQEHMTLLGRANKEHAIEISALRKQLEEVTKERDELLAGAPKDGTGGEGAPDPDAAASGDGKGGKGLRRSR